MNIDLSTDFGAGVDRRLKDEIIIWLTTVRPNGVPEPSPVWFYWDGSTCLIYSQPGKTKLKAIAANPNVALNFNTTATGGDVVVFTGEAQVDPAAPPAHLMPEYLAKYLAPIADIGMTPESFAKGYSVAIRVTPTKVRGF
jgi:PPOX class probable F420-dependent enzyme